VAGALRHEGHRKGKVAVRPRRVEGDFGASTPAYQLPAESCANLRQGEGSRPGSQLSQSRSSHWERPSPPARQQCRKESRRPHPACGIRPRGSGDGCHRDIGWLCTIGGGEEAAGPAIPFSTPGSLWAFRHREANSTRRGRLGASSPSSTGSGRRRPCCILSGSRGAFGSTRACFGCHLILDWSAARWLLAVKQLTRE
jgi:hypothetical protein